MYICSASQFRLVTFQMSVAIQDKWLLYWTTQCYHCIGRYIFLYIYWEMEHTEDNRQTINDKKEAQKPTHNIRSNWSEEVRAWSMIANFPILPSLHSSQSRPIRESQICSPINHIRCCFHSAALSFLRQQTPVRAYLKPSLFSIVKLSHSTACLWVFYKHKWWKLTTGFSELWINSLFVIIWVVLGYFYKTQASLLM